MDEEHSLRDRYRFALEQWARVEREAGALLEALLWIREYPNGEPDGAPDAIELAEYADAALTAYDATHDEGPDDGGSLGVELRGE